MLMFGKCGIQYMTKMNSKTIKKLTVMLVAIYVGVVAFCLVDWKDPKKEKKMYATSYLLEAKSSSVQTPNITSDATSSINVAQQSTAHKNGWQYALVSIICLGVGLGNLYVVEKGNISGLSEVKDYLTFIGAGLVLGGGIWWFVYWGYSYVVNFFSVYKTKAVHTKIKREFSRRFACLKELYKKMQGLLEKRSAHAQNYGVPINYKDLDATDIERLDREAREKMDDYNRDIAVREKKIQNLEKERKTFVLLHEEVKKDLEKIEKERAVVWAVVLQYFCVLSVWNLVEAFGIQRENFSFYKMQPGFVFFVFQVLFQMVVYLYYSKDFLKKCFLEKKYKKANEDFLECIFLTPCLWVQIVFACALFSPVAVLYLKFLQWTKWKNSGLQVGGGLVVVLLYSLFVQYLVVIPILKTLEDPYDDCLQKFEHKVEKLLTGSCS